MSIVENVYYSVRIYKLDHIYSMMHFPEIMLDSLMHANIIKMSSLGHCMGVVMIVLLEIACAFDNVCIFEMVIRNCSLCKPHNGLQCWLTMSFPTCLTASNLDIEILQAVSIVWYSLVNNISRDFSCSFIQALEAYSTI